MKTSSLRRNKISFFNVRTIKTNTHVPTFRLQKTNIFLILQNRASQLTHHSMKSDAPFLEFWKKIMENCKMDVVIYQSHASCYFSLLWHIDTYSIKRIPLRPRNPWTSLSLQKIVYLSFWVVKNLYEPISWTLVSWKDPRWCTQVSSQVIIL